MFFLIHIIHTMCSERERERERELCSKKRVFIKAIHVGLSVAVFLKLMS